MELALLIFGMLGGLALWTWGNTTAGFDAGRRAAGEDITPGGGWAMLYGGLAFVVAAALLLLMVSAGG